MQERIKVLKVIGENQNKKAGGTLKKISYPVGGENLIHEALMGCNSFRSNSCHFRWYGRCDGWIGKDGKPNTVKVVYCGRKIKEEAPH